MTKNVPKSKAKTAYGLLSEVRKLILEEPLRYNQACFIERRKDWESSHLSMPHFAACGTMGCVAGWVATLKHPDEFSYCETSRLAAEILGLTSDQEDLLFDGEAAKGREQTLAHAKSGAAHIARFQKKYEKQLKATRV
jgi:hypothetical protein